MTNLTIRPVCREDIPALMALEAAAFPDPWEENGLALLLNPPFGGLCAFAEGALAGYIGWLHFPADGSLPAEAEITRIAVSPALRRRGIGRLLLQEMLEHLAPDNAPITLRLDVRESNTAAQALYTGFGFAVCGRRPRFYGSEDALEMQLILPVIPPRRENT
ncbi:MAG: GNAT family N-acetyltransferase [Ruminococcaceae bacterium]|nr:GNAT family N-acetyltransferase [Oscillospiraceae bacterium]